MRMNNNVVTAGLALREAFLPAEDRLLDMLGELGGLLSTTCVQRSVANVPASRLKPTILSLTSAIAAQGRVSELVLEAHAQLAEIGRDKMPTAIGDNGCPGPKGELTVVPAAA